MAFTVSIAGADSMKIGEGANYTATASGAAVEGTVTYVWTVDDAAQSEATNVFRYTAAAPKGAKVIKVVATSTPAEGEPETAEATKTVTVNNKTMSVSVTLDPASVTKEIGQSQVVTANVTGAPSGSTISYVWKRNAAPISGETGQTITVSESAPANWTLHCDVTVTAADYDNGTATANTVITFTKKAMTLTCSIAANTTTPKHGEQVTITATAGGAPSGALTDYIWKLNGVAIEGAPKTPTYVFLAGNVGTEKYTCTYEAMHNDYEPAAKTSNELSVVIGKADQSTIILLESDKFEMEEHQTATLTADVANQPAGAVIKYEWFQDDVAVGTNTNTFAFTTDNIGIYEFKCKVTVTHANFVTFSQDTNIIQIEVNEVIVNPTIDPYIHPLPWRNSAYIWCGWWVMDEIQTCTIAGVDWQTFDGMDLPYYQHRLVLAKMLRDYPEVDVQESRNGYIVHRTALEHGIIYDYYVR